jgi:hypothetical protein
MEGPSSSSLTHDGRLAALAGAEDDLRGPAPLAKRETSILVGKT